MTKPCNFPERKRQRQLRALLRLAPRTQRGEMNDPTFVVLHERTKDNLRNVRTKKYRGDRAKFSRA